MPAKRDRDQKPLHRRHRVHPAFQEAILATGSEGMNVLIISQFVDESARTGQGRAVDLGQVINP